MSRSPSRTSLLRVASLAGTFAVAAVVAACGSSANSSGGTSAGASSAASTSAPASSRAAVTVGARNGPLGAYLVDGSGRTLYYFATDTTDRSTCYAVCAAGWPVVTANGRPTAGPGVDTAKLGTMTRVGGMKQVTYGGLPLYRFVLDARPGDILGQALPAFGAPWWMVDPANGRPITAAPPAVAPPPPAAAPNALTVTARRSSLGTYLSDGAGRSVYMFDADGANRPTCTGLCGEVWPPVLVKGHAIPGRGVDAGMLGTTKGADGTTQVTYDRKPLYYFALDGGKAGVTNGQGQRVAGADWWLVTPDGRTLTKRIPANGPAPPSGQGSSGYGG